MIAASDAMRLTKEVGRGENKKWSLTDEDEFKEWTRYNDTDTRLTRDNEDDRGGEEFTSADRDPLCLLRLTPKKKKMISINFERSSLDRSHSN